jgi:hypothetical protein
MPAPSLNLEDLAAAVAAGAMRQVLAELGKKDTAYTRSATKHDPESVAPSRAGFLHGPGGLLTYPGVDPAVTNAVIGTLPGIINTLPTSASRFGTPVFETITGISEPGGEEKDEPCDDALVGGVISGCKHTFPFGRLERRTRQVEINQLGLLNDRAEPQDLRLIGGASLTTPWLDSTFGQNAMNSEIDRLFFERAVSFNRALSQMSWSGNPVHNTPGGGYKEFAGIELLLSKTTGWADAETGVDCIATAPDIKEFNCARLDANDNGAALVRALTYMVRQTRTIAERTGLMPVNWAFAMRPNLFYEVTNIWPCAYLTNVCSTNDSYTYNIELSAQAEMRDSMRTGRYLLVDGVRIPVILDDLIPERTQGDDGRVTSGCFCSDIYLLPFSVLGGRAVLYLEHFDYSNRELAAAAGNPMAGYSVTANGAFLETASKKNWCIQWQAKIEPRLILKTPQLAGKLQNVQYCPLQVPPHPFPDDPYYRNGGETSRPGPSLFNPWAE